VSPARCRSSTADQCNRRHPGGGMALTSSNFPRSTARCRTQTEPTAHRGYGYGAIHFPGSTGPASNRPHGGILLLGRDEAKIVGLTSSKSRCLAPAMRLTRSKSRSVSPGSDGQTKRWWPTRGPRSWPRTSPSNDSCAAGCKRSQDPAPGVNDGPAPPTRSPAPARR
jgi:hypothetical protein